MKEQNSGRGNEKGFETGCVCASPSGLIRGALTSLLLTAMLLIYVFNFCCGGKTNQPKPLLDENSPTTDTSITRSVGFGAGGGDGLDGGGGDFGELGGGFASLDYGEDEGNEVIVPWTEPETGETVNIVQDNVIIVLAKPEDFTREVQDPPPNLDELDAQFLANGTIMELTQQGYEVLQPWGAVKSGLLRVPPGETFASVYPVLTNSILYPEIFAVHPNDLVPLMLDPNDPLYWKDPMEPGPYQWGLRNVDHPQYDVDASWGWDYETGEDRIVVAVN